MEPISYTAWRQEAETREPNTIVFLHHPPAQHTLALCKLNFPRVWFQYILEIKYKVLYQHVSASNSGDQSWAVEIAYCLWDTLGSSG